MNVKPKPKHSKEPQPIAAMSSPADTKPHVVRRFFGSQKMWACVSPKGRVDHWSIRYSRKDAIAEFVKSYNPEKYD